MSKEKTDAIFRVVVKHFFIEKEVTSTLVMDSLYSGLKALEDQTKSKKGRGKLLNAEELPVPVVCIDKDMFVLVDDVLLILERAAVEPLPPKDDKGPQNRMKVSYLNLVLRSYECFNLFMLVFLRMRNIICGSETAWNNSCFINKLVNEGIVA